VICLPEPFGDPFPADIFSHARGFCVNYPFLIPEKRAQNAPRQEIGSRLDQDHCLPSQLFPGDTSSHYIAAKLGREG
jgi:hypothetical protein